jgi:hypothetical protein
LLLLLLDPLELEPALGAVVPALDPVPEAEPEPAPPWLEPGLDEPAVVEEGVVGAAPPPLLLAPGEAAGAVVVALLPVVVFDVARSTGTSGLSRPTIVAGWTGVLSGTTAASAAATAAAAANAAAAASSSTRRARATGIIAVARGLRAGRVVLSRTRGRVFGRVPPCWWMYVWVCVFVCMCVCK